MGPWSGMPARPLQDQESVRLMPDASLQRASFINPHDDPGYMTAIPAGLHAAMRIKGMFMMTEQRVLAISIAMTFFSAAFGIATGLWSGSFAIIFDGVYALTDACMTMLALLVSRLIAAAAVGPAFRGRLADRFTMGFWHLEPMVLGLNGVLLMGAAVFALLNAVDSLMSGGRPMEFGPAIVFAAVTVVISLVMALFDRRANRAIRSDFITLDEKAWLMTAALTSALLLAFVCGYMLEGSRFEWATPYVDPLVLLLICLVIIPMPVPTVRQALADIFMVTPLELKQHVDEVAATVVARHGFISWRSYVARVGRGKQIELFFIVPADWPARRLEEWDALRGEIGEALGEASPDRWLTIVFTTDPEWAD